MDAKQLQKVIKQLEKYNLIKYFDTKDKLNSWLNGLTFRQINNFINLSADPDEVRKLNIGKILIYKNFLSCEKYPEIINILIYLKEINPKIDFKDYYIFNPHLYEDLNCLLKLNTIIIGSDVLFCLILLLEDKDFINSQYHKQDLELIINELNAQNEAAEALIELAADECSLKDTYHLANMQILSENPISIDFLFILMTTNISINSRYYQNDIAALYAAPSLRHTVALYIFITGDIRSCISLGLIDNHTRTQLIKPYLNISNNKIPNYLELLEFINTLPEDKVLPISFIIKNIYFINSPYFDFDIHFLQEINDSQLLIKLCKLVTNPNFISNPYHLNDLQIIKSIGNQKVKDLLCELATFSQNINSPYHMYDMSFIARYDNSETIDKNPDLIKAIRNLALTDNGLNDPNHIEKLEKIYRGEYILDCNKENTEYHEYIYPIFTPYSGSNEDIEEDEVSHYINTLKENPSLIKQPKKTLLTRVRERLKK